MRHDPTSLMRFARHARIALVLGIAAGPVPAQAARPAPDLLRAAPGSAVAGALDTRPAAGSGVRVRTCGTAEVTPADAEAVRGALRRWRDEHAAHPEGGVIRVAFHVITAGGEGEVTDERIVEQVRALNRDFAGSGFRFELASVDRTDRAGWFSMMPGSGRERQAKQALAIDPARWLNL